MVTATTSYMRRLFLHPRRSQWRWTPSKSKEHGHMDFEHFAMQGELHLRTGASGGIREGEHSDA